MTNPTSLRVMFDYASSGIWVMESFGPFRHGMIEHKALGISEELSKEFNNWIQLYNNHDGSSSFIEEYDRIGLDLAKKLKAELKDVKVFYTFEADLSREEEIT